MDKKLFETVMPSHALAYSSPLIVTNFLVVPAGIILPGIYVMHFGLELTIVATILLIARLFDAFTDPIVGYCSDHYRSRLGSRKPLIIIGGILFIISSLYLFIPPKSVSTTYYLGWSLAFYLAWTMIEIPHLAWGGELTSSSQERTKVFSFRALAYILGTSLFFIIPMMPFFDANEFTPKTLKWSVVIAGLSMLPLLYLCVKKVPNGHVYELHDKTKETFKTVLTSVIYNRPLLLFLCAYLISGIGMGMWMGLVFIFADSYLDIGKSLPLALTIGNAVGLVSIPIWRRLALMYEKKIVWSMGILLGSFAIACTGFLAPGTSAVSLFMCVLGLLSAVGVALQVLPASLLSDIVDYGSFKFGTDRAATYFSIYQLMVKANVGIGGALGLGIAGWYGFEPAATMHSGQGLLGLVLGIAFIPALLLLISLIFIFLIPINMYRHSIIQKRLTLRSQRYSDGSLYYQVSDLKKTRSQ